MKKINPPLVPPPLLPGDRVSVIAPASPFDRDEFQDGVSVVEQLGFRPVFSDGLFERTGYLAGPDQHRAAMFNAAFADDDTAGVWCVRGGYGALRILPLIDYPTISTCPKVLIGCSDITAIMHALRVNCGMVTFHGPMIGGLGRAAAPTIAALTEMFQWRGNWTVAPEFPVRIRAGNAAGPLAGGNLTTLCHLIGTPWHPDFSDCLLFLEDRGEALYRIDRMLTQMKLAGCFNGLAGLMLGSFEKCGPETEIHRMFAEVFSDMDIPVLAGLAAGHGEPNIILPIGITAHLDADAGTLIYPRLLVS
jgi:muramoyltetrapeptide carboxypeptidase